MTHFHLKQSESEVLSFALKIVVTLYSTIQKPLKMIIVKTKFVRPAFLAQGGDMLIQ